MLYKVKYVIITRLYINIFTHIYIYIFTYIVNAGEFEFINGMNGFNGKSDEQLISIIFIQFLLI